RSYDPINREGIVNTVNEDVGNLVRTAQTLPVGEVWALTIDEIGSVFGRSPEGGAHMGSCPHCQEAFREMVRADGRTLEDFGTDDWENVKALSGYWSKNYFETRRILTERLEEARARLEK